MISSVLKVALECLLKSFVNVYSESRLRKILISSVLKVVLECLLKSFLMFIVRVASRASEENFDF